MRVDVFLITGFRSNHVIAPSLYIICDLLTMATLIRVVGQRHVVSSSAAVVPDVTWFGVNIIAVIFASIRATLRGKTVKDRSGSVALPDLVRSGVSLPATKRPAVALDVENTKAHIGFGSPRA